MMSMDSPLVWPIEVRTGSGSSLTSPPSSYPRGFLWMKSKMKNVSFSNHQRPFLIVENRGSIRPLPVLLPGFFYRVYGWTDPSGSRHRSRSGRIWRIHTTPSSRNVQHNGVASLIPSPPPYLCGCVRVWVCISVCVCVYHIRNFAG